MDLLQLQYFQTIAQLENMTRAAEILYVAQPNLSISIKRLEDELGVSLFDRRKAKIKLTATGKLFLSYVDDILSQLDEAILHTRESGRHANEKVRVASVIVDLIGDLLDGFLPANPDVSFRQFNCRNSEVVGKIMNSEADFGFIFGTPVLQGLEYIEIDRCERVVMLGKDHPLAEKDIVSLRDLKGHRLVCNLSRDDEDLMNALSHSNRFRPEFFYECDDNSVEVRMVLRGGGLSIAPLSHYLKLIHKDQELGITCLRIREELPPARLGMIRKTGVHLSVAAIQFFEIVTRFFEHESEIAKTYSLNLPER